MTDRFKSFFSVILLIPLLFSLGAGCATHYQKISPRLKDHQNELQKSPSFAFIHEGQNYYFAPLFFKEENQLCYLYLGFKNEQLTYAFPETVFGDIQWVYRKNETPSQIKSLILEKLETQRDLTKKCLRVANQGTPAPDGGQGLGIALLFWPVSLAALAYHFSLDEIQRGQFQKVSSQLRLGMTRGELPGWIKDSLVQNSKGTYPYFEFRTGETLTLLYFENDQLNAWSQSLL